jgi:hypothetical protein
MLELCIRPDGLRGGGLKGNDSPPASRSLISAAGILNRFSPVQTVTPRDPLHSQRGFYAVINGGKTDWTLSYVSGSIFITETRKRHTLGKDSEARVRQLGGRFARFDEGQASRFNTLRVEAEEVV